MAIDNDKKRRFERCVQECAKSVYRVAFRLLGDETLANELVQETYLNAWRNIDSLSDLEKLKSWIFAILRNQYTKLLRAESKAVRTTELLDDSISQGSGDRVTGSPADSVELVQEALNGLEENFRMPILLVSMEGWSVEEAAELLDLPRGTVLSRLHRARQKLKEILSREMSAT